MGQAICIRLPDSQDTWLDTKSWTQVATADILDVLHAKLPASTASASSVFMLPAHVVFIIDTMFWLHTRVYVFFFKDVLEV